MGSASCFKILINLLVFCILRKYNFDQLSIVTFILTFHLGIHSIYDPYCQLKENILRETHLPREITKSVPQPTKQQFPELL